MSQASRRRRRQYQERSGATYLPSLTTLPRAQERVQQALEARAFDWLSQPPHQLLYPSPGGARHGLKASKRQGFKLLKQLRYKAPASTLVCQQRAVRREVIFALGRGGRGPRRGKKVRRTQNSQYSCR